MSNRFVAIDVETANPDMASICQVGLVRFSDGALVASHMPFDRTAIARAFDRYGLRPIDCTWIDTARVCRRAWPQFARRGYGLANVATWCGIEFRHHDALEDARAAGEILVRACVETNLTAREWAERALH